MKPLPKKVQQVERLMKKLDTDIHHFQQWSQLACLTGCGECCKKPDIEATPLEFLPLALALYDEGLAETTLEGIEQKNDSLCWAFSPRITGFGGLCSRYPQRGLICRLFGFSARLNKEGQKELVTCRFIKQQQAAGFLNTTQEINHGKAVPVMSHYYSRLQAIDPALARFYPINRAIAEALKVVMHYYAYRRRRKKQSGTAAV